MELACCIRCCVDKKTSRKNILSSDVRISLWPYIWPIFSFYTPWKHQETKGFLVYSGAWHGNIKWKLVNLTYLSPDSHNKYFWYKNLYKIYFFPWLFRVHQKMLWYGVINPLRANPILWLSTHKQFVNSLPTNCWSVFDHFVGLAYKGLTSIPPVVIRKTWVF